ncbi:hypothetical protein Tco_0328762 [Tanacetum coccineum]
MPTIIGVTTFLLSSKLISKEVQELCIQNGGIKENHVIVNKVTYLKRVKHYMINIGQVNDNGIEVNFRENKRIIYSPDDHENEMLRVDDERMAKEKESILRVSLENEISSLKSDVLSLSQKRSLVPESLEREEVEVVLGWCYELLAMQQQHRDQVVEVSEVKVKLGLKMLWESFLLEVHCKEMVV